MSNWIWNVLRISGDLDEMDEFENLARLKEGEIPSVEAMDISLNKVIPVPAELKTPTKGKEDEQERIKKYGVSNSYDWRIKNWGIASDILWSCEAGMIKKNGMLTYYFDTAYVPPIKWLELASKKFPNLVFLLKFVEQDHCFRGIALVIDGDIMCRSEKLPGIPCFGHFEGKTVPKNWKPKQPNTDRLSDFGF